MTLYCEIPTQEYGVYGICSVIIMIIAVFILIMACTTYVKWYYIMPASVLVLAALFMMQGNSDIIYLMLAIVVAELIIIVLFFRERRVRLTLEAIKEGLDELPDGVCFFDGDGQPLLVNTQMNRISGELSGDEILNAEVFWNKLKDNEIPDDDEEFGNDKMVLFHTTDGKIWDIRRDILTMGHSHINELIAYDVTGQYELNKELKTRNERLALINKRLHTYSREVEHVTNENEILNAKMQVHNNVGRSLLAFRSYLEQPHNERDREKLRLLWRYTIQILKQEAASDKPPSGGMEQILKAAQAVDVEIVLNGTMPDNENVMKVLISAMHECLTNTVKHANGDKLYIDVSSNDKCITAKIYNNGRPPSGTINETGGLKNLRSIIEKAGGRMRIDSIPEFVLWVDIPVDE